MIPALNEILFLLATLFGLNTVFVAEETKLLLNLEAQTVTIEYKDLKTPKEAVSYTSEELNTIDSAKSFIKQYPELTLLTKSITKENGKLNAHLTFSYKNQDDLFKALRFNTTHHGESTSSDAFYYHLLPSESLTSSNGTVTEREEGDVLKWAKKSKEIQMELKQNESAKDYLGEMVSMADYWKP